LGSSKKFAEYVKPQDEEHQKTINTTLQRLVNPYILRRLKSDKAIINDLPDKTELATYCSLTKEQTVLYQKMVDELTERLKQPMDQFERRGIVLAYLMRLKQVCNHPNQLLGHNQYAPAASGKFLRLQELCSLIAEKKEKVLVFTQFSEIIPSISAFLSTLFGASGLELSGKTAIADRAKLVAEFQHDDGPPFFVLSLKAGGTGLNLTKAAHVIHFDRWWNPAVEDQATDRAYRIGQKKNILVHKFICRGTIEEKIDMIIFKKRSLAQSIIGSDTEVSLAELSNEELLNIVTLDIERALDTDTERGI
jgi:non-specific serine/threonine protein kinase